MNNHKVISNPTLEDILKVDQETRNYIRELVKKGVN